MIEWTDCSRSLESATEGGHIIYNRTLLGFARHYGFLPEACRPYRAKTKGKVERPFRYVREDFFLGGQFRDLEDLNAQLHQWLDTVANVRVHATTRRVVAEHFAEEHPSLQGLPAGAFQAVLRMERRITRDGMVSVNGNLRNRGGPSVGGSTHQADDRRRSDHRALHAAGFLHLHAEVQTDDHRQSQADSQERGRSSAPALQHRAVPAHPHTARSATGGKLYPEWSGILGWMIDGCLDWRSNGLVRPKVVVDATSEYFAAQDIIGRWLTERCILDPQLEEKPGASSILGSVHGTTVAGRRQGGNAIPNCFTPEMELT